MEQFLVLALTNFTVSFLVIALLCALVSLACARKPLSRRDVAERLLFYYLFFGVGVTLLYNAVMHTIFREMTAGFIGWANSPFQLEVGYASLGFAVVGFVSCWRGSTCGWRPFSGPPCSFGGRPAGTCIQ